MCVFCGCIPMCLINFIGKCDVDKAISNFVHHTDLVDFSSALIFWKLKSGNESRGA